MKYLSFFIVILIISCHGLRNKAPVAPLIEGENITDHSALARKAMVVTQGHYATAAGIEMLIAGGNAIDAAVAVSFTIGVERPQSTGIGGGGFALVSALNKEVLAYDFRERAPENIKRDFYLDKMGNANYQKSQEGALAVGTPGLVAGLYKMHLEHGKLPWEKLLEPAIKLATNGFSIYPELAAALEKKKDVLATFKSSKKIFFNKQGEILRQGEQLIQSDLANTLKIIAKKGAQDFYTGSVAKKIVHSLKEHGGVGSLADLRKYRVKLRTPLRSKMGNDFQGVEIFSMPPPSSGGVHVLQILNMVEKHFRGKTKPLPWSSEAIHYTSLAMQQAFYDRAIFLGDPDFVSIPTKLLTSKEYADRSIKYFSPRSRKMEEIKTLVSAGEESFETTHFSIIDEQGMSVSSTQTINGWFGSGLVAEGTGIVLNNEMDDFSLVVGGSNLFGAYGGEKNFIQPLKRPLSSMSPTIVMKDGKPVMIVGSPSGTRIITCVALTLLNYLYYDMPLSKAVNQTRYHQQWSPDEIWMEKEGMTSSVISKLQKMGHQVIEKELGCKIQAIIVKSNKEIEGFSDVRGQGSAKGL